VYQPNDAAAIGIDSNRKTPCLDYTPRAGEASSLTQRYGPESLSQHMVEHFHEASTLYDVFGQ